MVQQNGAIETFAYDDQSRLTNVSGKGLLSNQPVNVTHTYDGNGDQLTTATTDAKGNKTTELTLYGANNQLLYKENQTQKTATDYYSLNGHIIAKTDHPAGQAATATEAFYLHDDLLGSPLQQTNTSGVAQRKQPQDYSPYGLERKIPTEGVHIGFTGKLNNSDTGISDFGARAYNPLLGRFMQQDPETVHDDKPFTFNRYAYANNNPLTYKDPKGDLPDVVEQFTGFGIGASIGYLSAQNAGYGSEESAIMGFYGGIAGFIASFVSTAFSAEAAEATVGMSETVQAYASFGAKVAGGATGGSFGSLLTAIGTGHSMTFGQMGKNMLSGVLNTFPVGKGINMALSQLGNGFGQTTFRVGVTTGVGTVIGYGKNVAINSMEHMGDHFGGKKKDKSDDFGIGHLGGVGLNNNTGAGHGGFNHEGAGSNRDPFDNNDFDSNGGF